MSDISVIGASGHAKVIIDLIEELGYRVGNIYDQDVQKDKLLGFKVTHDFIDIPRQSIIAIGNNLLRKKIAGQYNLELNALIHPSSYISKYSQIGNGTVVMAGVSINADSIIGQHCIINTNSSIDHECIIGDFVHVSPNSALAGNVQIGDCSHIGIGSCIKQGVKVGKNCIIGAGAVVIRDVTDGMTIVGNPGKELNKN